MNSEEATSRARADLGRRLGVAESDIVTVSVSDTVFPDAALGAYLEDEMAADVLTNGWTITLSGPDKAPVEYRGSANQLRLFNFKGENYQV
ncbi:MAG: hypothetical protein ABIP75_09935 [Pyrinomonadaceae bacterium]